MNVTTMERRYFNYYNSVNWKEPESFTCSHEYINETIEKSYLKPSASFGIGQHKIPYKYILYGGKNHTCYVVMNVNERQRYQGSVTCFGEKITNASCPNNQYMVIKKAEYRGLNEGNVCGSSYNYSCSFDVTCHLKRRCDGQRVCNISVDDNLFPSNICVGLNKYLYFEYQCNDTMTSLDDICYDNSAILKLNVPGCLQGVNKWGTGYRLDMLYIHNDARNINEAACVNNNAVKQTSWGGLQMRYYRAGNQFQCLRPRTSKELQDNQGVHPYLKMASCKSAPKNQFHFGHICARPLLNDTKKFPDSLFSASKAINLHNAANARISSGRSWCAPTADGNHYLQIRFEKLYAINSVAIFGDTTTLIWVTKYHINTTSDLINWESVSNQNSQKVFKGNKNGYKDAAISNIKGRTRTRALRLIPVTYKNRPCIRVELCGGELLPSSPTGLNITYSASRYVIISWMDPQNIAVTPGADVVNPLIKFRFILKKQRKVILNKTEPSNVAKPYMLSNLIPNTMYTVVVTAGNSEGFGDAANVSFKTKEDVPEGPPLNITISVISSFISHVEPPDKSKRNGRIVNYTVCIPPSESFKCSETFTTEYQSFIINELKPATTYYVWVLASTKIGFGNYSEKQMAITNGLPPKATVNSSEKTLTFSLEIPTVKYEYLFVIAMQGDRQNLPSPFTLNVEDLETYSTPSPPNLYVAAVLKPSGGGIFVFILGDGSNSSISGTRGRRSLERVYYNAPLKPNTTYRIFQRVVINDQGDYYSTEWSPSVRTTSELFPLPGDSIWKNLNTASFQSCGDSACNIEGHVSFSLFFSLLGDSKDDDNNDNNVTAIAAASAAAVVFAIVFVVLIILWRRRRAVVKEPKLHLQSEHEDRNGQELSVRNDAFIVNDNADPVVRPNEENIYVNKSISEEEMYGNKETIETHNRLPIPLVNFTEHVKKLRRKNMEELRLEFEDLPNGQKCNWVIAKSPMNSAKNRYGNAVKYDHSRVILSCDEKSDYINASFVDGKCEKYYIATQGPKPKTVNDFWRMIFEQKCPTIVMLTTLKEMGKVKCKKYWPDESNVYGEITVTITETKTFADYVTRIMVVEKNGEHHEVEQFHYKSWPDYGVPRYPTQLLTFRNHFKLSHKTKSGPVVVHCSAGVGRTGVFIALDKILDNLDDEYETNIDVFGFVEEMRSRRINMV
ncbi:receptor-type tyrosine-protein phosphatase T-like [Xenia sp. Carnegie-2017]|uniref:receptor-type tyrosine-protein phosphatase T-like n=1 Tax=Xenia sp. Carnegie-2017 TaxID=2897299 RepID=UPI001F034FDF|nr:receptor-type tyrosine-protein phosphatase T-like [Xenia sp. Carnegie-2017]